jgi:hypothetical protein
MSKDKARAIKFTCDNNTSGSGLIAGDPHDIRIERRERTNL